MEEAMFNELLESVKQMKAIERGELAPGREFTAEQIVGPDAAKIRRQMHLSQDKFAALLGIQVATLRNWEQGRRKPEGPARVLLSIAAREPETLLRVAESAPLRYGGAIAKLVDERMYSAIHGVKRRAAKKALDGSKAKREPPRIGSIKNVVTPPRKRGPRR